MPKVIDPAAPRGLSSVERLETTHRGWLPRAAGVVALVGAATMARLLLQPWMGTSFPLLGYSFAIAVTATLWGLRATALGVLLSVPLASWFFIEPIGSLAVADPSQRVSLLLFCLLGTVLGLLGERAVQHAAALRRALEALDERTRLQQDALASRDRSIAALETTDRRLRHTVEEFESLMRLAPVGIVVSRDPDGGVVHGNPYAERLLDASPGENLSASAPVGRRAPYRVRRDDAAVGHDELPLRLAARTGLPVTDVLHEFEFPDGEVRAVLMNAVPLQDVAGHARGAIGTMLDVTSLRSMQSQLETRRRQLRTLFEAMSDGYGIVEAPPGDVVPADWRLVEANGAFARLTGLQDAVGRPLRELAPGRELPWLEGCAQVVADGAAFEAEYCDPALDSRWFCVNAHSLDPQRHARVAVLLREVTERKRAEQDAAFLLYLADQMRRQADSPDALVNTVLQSLRTHLGADRARLTEVDVAARHSRVIREVAPPGRPRLEAGHRLGALDTPLMRQLASGRTAVVGDVARDPAAAALVRAGSATRAFVSAPLLRGGHWVASLAVAAAQPRDWTAREVQLVDTVAERLWAALEIARAGESLRESEQRFRLMADGLPMLVWMHDAQGALHFVNREYCRFFGVTREQVAGAGWQPLVHPDDAPAYVAEFQRCLRGRRGFHAQARVRDASGAWRWIDSHGEPRFLPDGTLLGIVGATVDVTERRQSELDREFLFALGDALQRCRSRVAIADIAARRLGEYLDVDRCGLVELAGADGHPAVLREFLAGHEPPLGGPRPMRHDRLLFDAELRSGATVVVADATTDARLADHRSLLERLGIRALVVVPLRRGGELAATLGIWQLAPRAWTVREVDLVRSVAERLWPALETAQAMEATAARAARGGIEAANRLKDEFLATISHELRTPLANIVSWTYVVQQSLGRDAEAVRRGLGIIAGNARAQSNLISDLLDMSRVVQGKLRLDCAPVALDDLVADCVESHSPAAAAAGITLDHQCRVAPGTRVHADARRLRQVIGNLLTNALKFTPAGGTVVAEVAQAGADYEIVVRDDGEGIDPALLPQLFERFRQGDSSAARGHGGLGIGLSLVRQLVELHGGSVTAHSAGRGRGSTFRVLLPAGAHDLGAADAAATNPGLGAPGPAVADGTAAAEAGAGCPDLEEDGCHGLRILAVEDEASMREFIQRTLEERGAHVRSVASAAEALRLLQDPCAGGFDVLVSDIGLPELDGYRMIRRIREELQIDAGRLPAIAVTAFSRDEDRARSLEAGFQAHLAKPYSVAQLVRLISRYVSRAGAPAR